MTHGPALVLSILGAAIALFAVGRPRADVVAILVVLALTLTGVLTINEALAGFGDPVVILIAAVAIVGEGLVATGIVARLGEAVMKAGGTSEAKLVALIMVLAGSIGAFMSSSAIVIMFIPVVLSIAARVGLNPRRMLMPLAVAANVSGMMTLIASSPNLIIENALRANSLAPLNFFSWTPFGIGVLGVSILFMLAFGRDMMSKRLTAEDAGPRQPSAMHMVESYGLAGQWHRLQLPGQSPLVGQPVLGLVSAAGSGIVPVGLERHAHGGAVHYLPATPQARFEAGDIVIVVADQVRTQGLIAANRFTEMPRLSEEQRRKALQELGVAEIMLMPESPLIGKTLAEIDFHARYGLSALAIRRRGTALTAALNEEPLAFSDTLLVAGGWANVGRLRDNRQDFVVLTLPAEYGDLIPAESKGPVAVAIVVAMVVTMAVGVVPNSAAALLAALALIATGCVKLESVYRIISWKTLVLVAGMLPLATALGKTGTTALMANGMVGLLGSLGPIAVLAAVFLVTAVVGLFISNSATAVLMAPVAIEAAKSLHDSPQAFAMTVAIGCCAAYVTPVSSAVNTLVMEPGRYSFGDYVKVGIPLLLLTMIVTVGLASIMYR